MGGIEGRVSILGLVDKGLRHNSSNIFSIQIYVSILGLVDKGLRPIWPVSEKHLESSFNPWFSG